MKLEINKIKTRRPFHLEIDNPSIKHHLDKKGNKPKSKKFLKNTDNETVLLELTEYKASFLFNIFNIIHLKAFFTRINELNPRLKKLEKYNINKRRTK